MEDEKMLRDANVDLAKKNDEMYEFFYSNRSPFSQWHKCKFTDHDGIQYTSAEQYMMYQKAKLFGDDYTAGKILKTNNQKRIKELGREVRGFDEMRWRKFREAIVVEGNILKFQQNKELLNIMLATGTKHFVEASQYDRIWGIGLSEDYARATSPETWPGMNLLGKCLDRVRSNLAFQRRMGQVPAATIGDDGAAEQR